MTTSYFKTIAKNVTSETIIEKSKFIATLKRVSEENEALTFLAQVKKKYWDASHNCFAFILSSGAMRSNDDGEPSGTAGKPILECLKKNELQDVAVVITRYFGGIKLGTGGLIRAYTTSTQDGVLKSGITEKVLHKLFTVNISYPLWDKVESFFKLQRIIYEKPIFSHEIEVKVFVINEKEFINKITDLCNGLITITQCGEEFIEVLLLKQT